MRRILCELFLICLLGMLMGAVSCRHATRASGDPFSLHPSAHQLPPR